MLKTQYEKRFTFAIPEAFYQKLHDLSTVHETSMGHQIREILTAGLEQLEKNERRDKKK